MRITSGRVILEDAIGIAPNPRDFIVYTDESGLEFLVPMKLVLRLYSIAEYECKRAGKSWDEECERIMRL